MADPSAFEQYMLELINRARADPEAEADRLGVSLNEGLPAGTISSDPKQPLAFNLSLVDAAEGHTAWMIETGVVSNVGANGSTPEDRMVDAGYGAAGTFEFGESVFAVPDAGPVDDPLPVDLGHDLSFTNGDFRDRMLRDEFKEVGLAPALATQSTGETVETALVVTQDFATRSSTDAFLTGVAFNDTDSNDFYTVGEGVGGVTVEAVRASDGLTVTTTTMTAGGYQMELPAGTYTVSASAGGTPVVVASSVRIADENVKVDIEDLTVEPPATAVNIFGVLVAGVPQTIVSSGTGAQIIDAPGSQIIELETSASLELQGTSGSNIYVLPGNAGDFTISRDFADISVAGPNGESLSFVARTTAQTLIFSDGAVDLLIQGDGVVAGSQSVTETAAAITAPLDPVPTLPAQPTSPPDSPNFFGIVTDAAPAQMISGGTNARIIDADGAQTYHLDVGAALDLQASDGANTISMQANAGDVDISRDVATVTLEGPSGEVVTVSARTTAQTLVFLDGSLEMQIVGDTVLAGDQDVTGTPTALTAALDVGDTSSGVFGFAASGADDLLLL